MKPLNVVLICPPVVEVIEPWVDAPPYTRDSLPFLAAYLRQEVPCNIKIIDAKFEQLSFDETVKRALSFNPDVVGLTAYTQEMKPAAYTAGLIKKQRPDVVAVIGGVHVTALPEQTLKQFPVFDFAVAGEGEITFSELCLAIANNEGFENID